MTTAVVRCGCVSVWTSALLMLALDVGAQDFRGRINGTVTDNTGAVLPGVTVITSSPALIQPQTTVTSETGNYRFPAVPPGVYSISFELAGFNSLKRDGIQITLGFTAQVNVELALATLQETVTVSGASPVIDTSTTRVQQNFKMDQLQSIPNGRDMWALLAVTPLAPDWVIDFPIGGGITVDDSVADSSGNQVLLGRFRGTVDFDPGSGLRNLHATTENGFLAKYDAAGALIAADQHSGASSHQSTFKRGRAYGTGIA